MNVRRCHLKVLHKEYFCTGFTLGWERRVRLAFSPRLSVDRRCLSTKKREEDVGEKGKAGGSEGGMECDSSAVAARRWSRGRQCQWARGERGGEKRGLYLVRTVPVSPPPPFLSFLYIFPFPHSHP